MERRTLSRIFAFGFLGCTLAAVPALAGNDAWSVVGQPSGGSVIKVVVNPATPSTLYAVSGPGIFMSTDSGTSWTVSLSLPMNYASDVAVDPLTPTTLYAASQGDGLWKSTDGGNTWTAINNGIPNLAPDDAQEDSLYRIVVDPKDEGTLYTLTLNHGIYKSTDGGNTWNAANNGLGTLLSDVEPMPNFIAVDPVNPQIVYLAADALNTTNGGAFDSDPNSGLYMSTDGGGSWTEVLSSIGMDGVVIDPSNHLNVYASGLQVFFSSDGGNTFTPESYPVATVLTVDPSDSKHLWGTDLFENLYVSSDQGGSWTKVSDAGVSFVMSVAVDPVTSANVYMASGSLAVSKSTDGGSTWADSYAGIYNVVTQDMFMGSDGAIYIGSLGSGVLKSTDQGVDWTVMNNGLTSLFSYDSLIIYALTQDPKDPATLYAGTVAGLYQTTDGAQDWTLLSNGITDPYTMAVAVDPENDQNVYIGTMNHDVFKSADGGKSWAASSTGITDTEVMSLAVSPTNSNVVFAGTWSKGLFESTDGGNSWSSVNTGHLVTGVWAIAIDPSNADNIYISLTNQDIYKSTDGGQTWASSSNGLPPGYIFNTLTIDSGTPTTLYVTGIADTGVYVSTDAGADWSALGSSGLPSTQAVKTQALRTQAIRTGGHVRTSGSNPQTAVTAVAVDPTSDLVYGSATDGQVYVYDDTPSSGGTTSGSGGSTSGSGGTTSGSGGSTGGSGGSTSGSGGSTGGSSPGTGSTASSGGGGGGAFPLLPGLLLLGLLGWRRRRA